MATPTRPGPTRPGSGGRIGIALFLVLVAIAFVGFLGSGYFVAALFPIAMVAGLIGIAWYYLAGRKESHEVVAAAQDEGAPSPADFWGKVVTVSGTCPDGATPTKGQTFVVSGQRVWPELCPHAREAIFALISRIEDDEVHTSEPARVLDNDHRIMMEVHKGPADERRVA